MKWTLEGFLNGEDFSSMYGRLCLPVLVAKVEQYQGVPDDQIPEFTYRDLAKIVASPKYAHPLHYALGSIGYALEALNGDPKWTKRKIPPIQLMIWSAGQGSPGDDAFNFIGISKQQVAQMPTAARQATARSVRSTILAYPHWREVLSALQLKPLTLPVPPSEAGTGSHDADWQGGGESIHHKRLKMYLASNYWELGLNGQFQAAVEVCLPSGDKIDLVLRDAEQTTCICVEVKSRISGDDDLIRGIFQCVKYQAVLVAQDRYELQRNRHYAKRTILPILATERLPSVELRTMCEFLNIQVVTVVVPDSYPDHPVSGKFT